jgi:hypothetical protein
MKNTDLSVKNTEHQIKKTTHFMSLHTDGLSTINHCYNQYSISAQIKPSVQITAGIVFSMILLGVREQ